MFTDFVLNGTPHGRVAGVMQQVRFDPGLMRPYMDTGSIGKTWKCCTVNTGRMVYNKAKEKYEPEYEQVRVRDLMDAGVFSPVFNATAMPKESWIKMDTKILMAARLRLRFYADIAKRNTYGGFDGMSHPILEYQTATDPGEAIQDMDGLGEGRTDAPSYNLQGFPITLTHSDFWFSERELAVSRNSGMPVDVWMGEAAGRRVAETIEKISIGVDTGLTYGGNSSQVGGYVRSSTVWGALNFPGRLQYNSMYLPTTNGWTPSNTIDDVLAMIDQLALNKFHGPFMIYTSNDWNRYLDKDYILTGGNVATQTLRERLMRIGEDDENGKQILGVRRLDFLTAQATAANDPAQVLTANPLTFIIVQLTEDVVRAINGQDITTIQWPSVGGLRTNYKVLAMQAAQFRNDAYGNCGLLVGT